MTQDDIIRMARESQKESFVGDTGHWFKMEVKDLERFAALVAAHEHEACAKVCDAYADKCVEAENWEAEDVSLHCAAAIRAMG